MWYIFAILAAFLWGIVYTVDQKLLERFSPVSLLFLSSIFWVIVLGGYIWYNKEIISLDLRKDKLVLATMFLSFCLTFLASYCIYVAIQKLGSSRASVFEIMYPFFVIIFSFFFFKDSHINLPFILGSLLLFFGSYIIIRYS